MSEFLAEARIVVRPDTTQFRAALVAQIAAVTKGVVAPIQVVPIQAGPGLAATTAQAQAATAALNSVTAAQVAGAQATKAASAAAVTHAKTIGQVGTAAGAAGAGLLGLRGAVLTASAGFLGATVAFQAGIKSIQSAAELETQLNVFRVTVGATSAEMERAGENARALGRDLTLPGVSARDAAEAQLQLARAGLDVNEAIAGTRGVLQLATAAEIDFGTAADLTAGNLNAFGLAGEEAVRVADLLTGAANESQGSIEDMGIGLRQVAGAASLLGLTVEDTVALLTQLTRAGLAGSDAGTTLRVALVRLARPDVREEVEKLVGSLENLQGNLDPTKVVKLADEIARSGGKLDQTNRLYELFGENALRVIGLLGQEGVQGFQRNREAVTEAGLAAETAGARMKGLEGDLAALRNEADAVGLSLGQLASPIISSLAGGATQGFRGINLLTEGIRNLVDPPREVGTSFQEMQFAIEDARQDLEQWERTSGSAEGTEHLEEQLEKAQQAFLDLGVSARDAADGVSIFEFAAAGVNTTLQELIEKLKSAKAVGEQAPNTGLGVQQVLNRVAGLDAAEVRARIRGDTNELVGVLEEEQAFLIGQLERQAVKNRPALRRQLEAALLGVTNDLASIQEQGARETEQAAGAAARAQQDADQQLLATLSNRRSDVERAGQQAEVEGNLQRAIRFEDRLQDLIKKQIQKVRAQIDDEKARAAAVRELRLALIASRREEDALRQERAEAIAANKAEAINLDIDFAETIGNVNREVAARQRLIALLKKQQAAVKKGSNEWKRLRNAIAEQQEAIKEARDQADDNEKDGQSAQQFFFEQLQAQQGFAANLLGNLIPRDQTAGLVGVPSPAPGAQIKVASAQAEGKAGGGPTAGQASTTNDILLRILAQLRALNDDREHPEATRQRRKQMAVMDFEHGQGGVM